MNKIRRFWGVACLSLIAIFCCSVSVSAEKTPEIMISSYEVSEGEAVEGGSFELTLEVKNVSTKNYAYNVLVSVSSDKDLIYSDYGIANQGYIDSIAPNATKTLTFVLEVADLAPDVVKTEIALSFADKDNILYNNETAIWIPVETKGKINISEFTISESILSGDKARVNTTLSNAGDSDISGLRIHLTENGSEIVNELISKSLLVEETTSFETYLDALEVGNHEIIGIIEYTSENGETYTCDPKTFQVEVTENIGSVTEDINRDNVNTNIYLGGIIILMVICLIIIVKQIKVKK